jgi:hypothetical protein
VLGVEAWTTIRYLNAQGVGIRAICRSWALANGGTPYAAQ